MCKLKKWAEIGRDLGYSGKIMSSLSTSLKNSYQKWLQPYEDYLRVAKPGVQHQLELENGGPFTPSPGTSPLKKSQNNTPNGDNTPAMRASAALNASLDAGSPAVQQTPVKPTPPAPAPAPIQGFTPVNGGFTSVNRPSGFTSVNVPNEVHATPENPRSVPRTTMDSPQLQEHNTPTFEPNNFAKRPLTDTFNKLWKFRF